MQTEPKELDSEERRGITIAPELVFSFFSHCLILYFFLSIPLANSSALIPDSLAVYLASSDQSDNIIQAHSPEDKSTPDLSALMSTEELRKKDQTSDQKQNLLSETPSIGISASDQGDPFSDTLLEENPSAEKMSELFPYQEAEKRNESFLDEGDEISSITSAQEEEGSKPIDLIAEETMDMAYQEARIPDEAIISSPSEPITPYSGDETATRGMSDEIFPLFQPELSKVNYIHKQVDQQVGSFPKDIADNTIPLSNQAEDMPPSSLEERMEETASPESHVKDIAKSSPEIDIEKGRNSAPTENAASTHERSLHSSMHDMANQNEHYSNMAATPKEPSPSKSATVDPQTSEVFPSQEEQIESLPSKNLTELSPEPVSLPDMMLSRTQNKGKGTSLTGMGAPAPKHTSVKETTLAVMEQKAPEGNSVNDNAKHSTDSPTANPYLQTEMDTNLYTTGESVSALTDSIPLTPTEPESLPSKESSPSDIPLVSDEEKADTIIPKTFDDIELLENEGAPSAVDIVSLPSSGEEDNESEEFLPRQFNPITREAEKERLSSNVQESGLFKSSHARPQENNQDITTRKSFNDISFREKRQDSISRNSRLIVSDVISSALEKIKDDFIDRGASPLKPSVPSPDSLDFMSLQAVIPLGTMEVCAAQQAIHASSIHGINPSISTTRTSTLRETEQISFPVKENYQRPRQKSQHTISSWLKPLMWQDFVSRLTMGGANQAERIQASEEILTNESIPSFSRHQNAHKQFRANATRLVFVPELSNNGNKGAMIEPFLAALVQPRSMPELDMLGILAFAILSDEKEEVFEASVYEVRELSQQRIHAIAPEGLNDEYIVANEQTSADTLEDSIVAEIYSSSHTSQDPIISEVITEGRNRTPSREDYQLRMDNMLVSVDDQERTENILASAGELVIPLPIRNDIEIEISGDDSLDELTTQLFMDPHPMEKGGIHTEAENISIKLDRPSGNKIHISVEQADKGAYTLRITNMKTRPVMLDMAFLFYGGKESGESTLKKNREAKGHGSVSLRFLIPEILFWDEDESFTGIIEGPDHITKFNSDTGLVWKEKKNY